MSIAVKYGFSVINKLPFSKFQNELELLSVEPAVKDMGDRGMSEWHRDGGDGSGDNGGSRGNVLNRGAATWGATAAVLKTGAATWGNAAAWKRGWLANWGAAATATGAGAALTMGAATGAGKATWGATATGAAMRAIGAGAGTTTGAGAAGTMGSTKPSWFKSSLNPSRARDLKPLGVATASPMIGVAGPVWGPWLTVLTTV